MCLPHSANTCAMSVVNVRKWRGLQSARTTIQLRIILYHERKSMTEKVRKVKARITVHPEVWYLAQFVHFSRSRAIERFLRESIHDNVGAWKRALARSKEMGDAGKEARWAEFLRREERLWEEWVKKGGGL